MCRLNILSEIKNENRKPALPAGLKNNLKEENII